MRPLRSLLFVPGNKPTWVEKAWKAEPDGIILDLEDAVPQNEKESAGASVRAVLDSESKNRFICVRLNGLATGLTFDDLQAVVHVNLDAVMLPKVMEAADFLRIDSYLQVLERRNGLPEQAIRFIFLLETAQVMRQTYEITLSSPRVEAVLMSAGPGGDAQRAIGYRWTKAGTETLSLRSQVLLDIRASGTWPLINSWYDVGDLEGLRADAHLNRQLGYMGMAVIHPTHVPVVNEVFTPTADEVDFYKGLIQAFEEAEKAGRASVVYEGDMIDSAMVRTAREFIAFANVVGARS
jgi:citrate lyase subunit beta/citryl-CoA lyase